MIQLSIVVPIYNTDKYLGRCLDSLLRQDLSYNEYEIIVINDGSQNKSGEIIKSYMAEYPHISYCEPDISGIFEIRNVGITLARGKYIYFVDSDDYISTHVLGKVTSFMNKEELDIFGFGIIKTTESSIPTPPIEKNLKGLTIYNGQNYISKFNFVNESVWLVINLNFLRTHNIVYPPGAGFPKGIFTVQLFYHSKRVAVIPDNIYADFQHPSSILLNPSPEQNRDLLRKYESTTDEYMNFRRVVELENTLSASGLERIRSKSISYIFFMLIRAVKSNLSIKEIGQMLRRLRSKNYYPIKGFMGSDYRSNISRSWLFIINNKILFMLFIAVYRSLNPWLKRFS
ncbi:glycosyltransferase [uncultured Eudoraea sp.]|uniref:glycosyltransferase family 2 protein n=1 Tax=uncultured Eudoraea sp. TaxID=1035614 RepID=UPI002604E7A1|nr:glycosyltransferase [uncultured Eudoraea sp.]